MKELKLLASKKTTADAAAKSLSESSSDSDTEASFVAESNM